MNASRSKRWPIAACSIALAAVLGAAKALSADSAVISAVSIAANNPYGTSSPWGYPGGDLYGGLGMGRGVAQGAMLGFPLGGVQVATAFSAATTVFEVGNGQELWSVRVPLTGSDDAKIQVARLSGASIDAMRRAGLLGPIATGKR